MLPWKLTIIPEWDMFHVAIRVILWSNFIGLPGCWTEDVCVGTQLIDGSDGGRLNLASPIDEQGHYSNRLSCSWRIIAAPGQIVRLTFEHFDVEQLSGRCYDNLRIFDGNSDSATPLGTLCGTVLPDDVVSHDRWMYVLFRSDSQVTGTGFRAHISFQASKTGRVVSPCPGPLIIDEISGIRDVTSPGYRSSMYDNDLSCSWRIVAPDRKRVQLHFVGFNIEEDASCSRDFLRISNGESSAAATIKNLCGSTLPHDVESYGPWMYLNFTTDSSGSSVGFAAQVIYRDSSYPVVAGACPGPLVVDETTQNLVIASPNYDIGDYRHDERCTWRIRAPSSMHIRLHFLGFNVMKEAAGCLGDGLSIWDGGSESSPMIDHLCGDTLPHDLYSSGQEMFIRFSTNSRISQKGFSIQIIFEDPSLPASPVSASCPGPLYIDESSSSLHIKSPNFGVGRYRNDESCSWIVKAPEGKIVLLHFLSMEIESMTSCKRDVLIVFDGNSTSARKYMKLCQKSLPDDLTTSGPWMYLTFTTDNWSTYHGFHASISFIVCLNDSFCQNGGRCANHSCLCLSGYTGNLCQIGPEEESFNRLPIVLVAVCIFLLALTTVAMLLLRRRYRASQSKMGANCTNEESRNTCPLYQNDKYAPGTVDGEPEYARVLPRHLRHSASPAMYSADEDGEDVASEQISSPGRAPQCPSPRHLATYPPQVSQQQQSVKESLYDNLRYTSDPDAVIYENAAAHGHPGNRTYDARRGSTTLPARTNKHKPRKDAILYAELDLVDNEAEAPPSGGGARNPFIRGENDATAYATLDLGAMTGGKMGRGKKVGADGIVYADLDLATSSEGRDNTPVVRADVDRTVYAQLAALP